MPSATFSKFNAFVAAIANKTHNLGSDQLAIALSNTAPTAAGAVLTDITQISYTNLSTRNVGVSSSSQTSGLYKLMCANLTLTASGAVPTFRYVVLYNSTAAGGPLIAWWDYGTGVTMASADTFAIQFDGTNGVLQLGP